MTSKTLDAVGISIDQLREVLANMFNNLVLNETGLNGRYDVHIQWTPEQPPSAPDALPQGSDLPDPSIFTALEERLGLKLESRKEPVETLVIDHAERPGEN